MPYGPQKYPAPELARNITEVIGDHLARFSAFNNTSLCYFGAKVKYRIEIELFSRGETKEIVVKETQIGEIPTMDEQTDPALAIRGETVVVEGEKSAGRIPKPVVEVEKPPQGTPAGAGNGRGNQAAKPDRGAQRHQPAVKAPGSGAGEAGGNRASA